MDLAADVAVSAGSMVSRLLILTRCKSPLKSGAASVTILTIFWPLLSVSCVTIVTWYVVTATETICSAGSGGSAAWLPAPGQQSLRGGRGGKVATSRDQLSSPPTEDKCQNRSWSWCREHTSTFYCMWPIFYDTGTIYILPVFTVSPECCEPARETRNVMSFNIVR